VTVDLVAALWVLFVSVMEYSSMASSLFFVVTMLKIWFVFSLLPSFTCSASFIRLRTSVKIDPLDEMLAVP